MSVDLANQIVGTKTHLGPVKDMGPGLYGWEDTGEFTAWMELNLEEIPNPTQVYAITVTEDTVTVYFWLFFKYPYFSLTSFLFLFPLRSPLSKSPLSALRSHTSVL